MMNSFIYSKHLTKLFGTDNIYIWHKYTVIENRFLYLHQDIYSQPPVLEMLLILTFEVLSKMRQRQLKQNKPKKTANCSDLTVTYLRRKDEATNNLPSYLWLFCQCHLVQPDTAAVAVFSVQSLPQGAWKTDKDNEWNHGVPNGFYKLHIPIYSVSSSSTSTRMSIKRFVEMEHTHFKKIFP